MPLKSFIRRKLLSLLQPWLREEPQLDIQLGFRHSLAVTENLRFDVSVLNQLFDSPSCLFIKELTIEHLTLRFSPWHSAAFDIEVHGVRVVLAFDMPDEEVSARRLHSSKFDYTDYLRKCLEVLDPEGCSLHHVLESIVFADPERKDLTSSFLNLIMKSSHLEAHDINMRKQVFSSARNNWKIISNIEKKVSQIQHVCTADRKEASDAPNLVDKAEHAWVDTYEYYAKQMIIYLFQKLPQNHFHFGAFVDGPFVRFSLKREAGLDGQDINDIASHDNFDINFDFHDIEVAVGSPSLLDMSPLTDPFGLDDAKAEYITLKPCVVDIPKPDNDKYVSSGKISVGSYIHQNGLNVYLEELEDKHQIQLLVVKPIIVQILSVR
ncbi:hypothetical protein Ahy_A09g045742 [Arachis hypogaea]|uniref:Uncharacterized protein n=1 Tax=Arachis hypogaea TaxID=3818 RepID=A0A445BN24_ARAHY|nr:hypothetical protein Ahy_A09g045742 [Arachis hypogaea]